MFSIIFVFEKFSNIEFRETPYSGSRVVPRGRTDGRTDRHDCWLEVSLMFNGPCIIVIVEE